MAGVIREGDPLATFHWPDGTREVVHPFDYRFHLRRTERRDPVTGKPVWPLKGLPR